MSRNILILTTSSPRYSGNNAALFLKNLYQRLAAISEFKLLILASDSSRVGPADSDRQQGKNPCEVSDMKTDGNTVSWTYVCKTEGGEMTGKGKITYHGDRFDGQVTMDYMGMTMVTKMSGRRTGPCQ